ncbi:MAG: TonB-dependent receptor [Spirochaetales bacterium]|nr:TonB-dependent receptor [Spirochaetales bacterium]
MKKPILAGLIFFLFFPSFSAFPVEGSGQGIEETGTEESGSGTEEKPGSEFISLDEEDDAQRIIITGFYDPLDPRCLSAQVSVLTAEEISASGARTAAEALASVPGIVLVRYGGRGQGQLISLRGASSDKVLVLVNGRRMNTAQGGGVDLSRYSAEDLERIEIIRGGRSAVYGPGAFGGVINIITKASARNMTGFSAYYGFASQSTHEGGLTFSASLGTEEQCSFHLSLKGLSSRGDYSYYSADYQEVLRRENAEALSGGGEFSMDWRSLPEKGIVLSLSGSHQSSTRGVPGMEGFPTPEASLSDSATGLFLDVSAPISDSLQLTTALAVRNQHRQYDEDLHNNEAAEGTVEAAGVLSPNLYPVPFTVGGAYRYDSLDSTALQYSDGAEDAGKAQRHTASGYVRIDIPLFSFKEADTPRLILSPALRYDYAFSAFSDIVGKPVSDRWSVNGGVLFLFDPERRLVLKANAGTAYNLPSFDDLFWLESGFALGNPNLLPEESLQLDAGVIWQPADPLILEIVYYRQDVTNLIQWNPGAGGLWRPRNIGAALITGTEAEGRVLIDLPGLGCFLEGKANYTLLIAENREESWVNQGKQLPHRPKHQAGLSVTLNHYLGHTVNLSGTYVGYRYTNEGNTRFLKDYFLLDLSLGLKLGKHYELACYGKNLLNTPYVSRLFYPVPGAEFGIKGRVFL